MADSVNYFTWPVLTWWQIYQTSYCLAVLEESENPWISHVCIEEVKVFSMTETEVKEMITSSLWNSFVFVLLLLCLGWIFRILYYKFFWWRR